MEFTIAAHAILKNHGTRTFSGGGVNTEPQFIHQELANLKVPHTSSGVEHILPLIILHTPQVHLFRHL